MIPLQIQQLQSLSASPFTPLRSFLSPPHHLLSPVRRRPRFRAKPNRLCRPPLPQIPCSSSRPIFRPARASETETWIFRNEEGDGESSSELDDLSPDGAVYRKTLALVECSMFAALTGLVYFLSNSLAIENYFGCFFSLPIVISSMRWGVPAGRKTMVATTMLLLVLSGPVKALTYLEFFHFLCSKQVISKFHEIFRVRALGAVGYVLISSFLIRENILALITINIHASLTFLFTASGVYIIPSMEFIYTLFGVLRIVCILVAPVVFGVPCKAWDEGFIENAKMARESYIVAQLTTLEQVHT
ncbi:hypothetical protein TIFTF001_008120 [Ficus carica]|uniref:Uncharacterized protein n=1 Tax=Ficus carica TaxID=3494 RepID=A0AA88DGW0_FICCA|nr:hypothetical protein TIFTF001_008120 [Ficus carica]